MPSPEVLIRPRGAVTCDSVPSRFQQFGESGWQTARGWTSARAEEAHTSIRSIGTFTAGAVLASMLTFTGMQSWQAGAAPGDDDTDGAAMWSPQLTLLFIAAR